MPAPGSKPNPLQSMVEISTQFDDHLSLFNALRSSTTAQRRAILTAVLAPERYTQIFMHARQLRSLFELEELDSDIRQVILDTVLQHGYLVTGQTKFKNFNLVMLLNALTPVQNQQILAAVSEQENIADFLKRIVDLIAHVDHVSDDVLDFLITFLCERITFAFGWEFEKLFFMTHLTAAHHHQLITASKRAPGLLMDLHRTTSIMTRKNLSLENLNLMLDIVLNNFAQCESFLIYIAAFLGHLNNQQCWRVLRTLIQPENFSSVIFDSIRLHCILSCAQIDLDMRTQICQTVVKPENFSRLFPNRPRLKYFLKRDDIELTDAQQSLFLSAADKTFEPEVSTAISAASAPGPVTPAVAPGFSTMISETPAAPVAMTPPAAAISAEKLSTVAGILAVVKTLSVDQLEINTLNAIMRSANFLGGQDEAVQTQLLKNNDFFAKVLKRLPQPRDLTAGMIAKKYEAFAKKSESRSHFSIPSTRKLFQNVKGLGQRSQKPTAAMSAHIAWQRLLDRATENPQGAARKALFALHCHKQSAVEKRIRNTMQL